MPQVVTQLIVDSTGAVAGVAAFEAAMAKAKGGFENLDVATKTYDQSQKRLQQTLASNDPVFAARLKMNAELARQEKDLTQSVKLRQISETEMQSVLAATTRRHEEHIQKIKESTGQLTLGEKAMGVFRDGLSGTQRQLVALSAGLGPVGTALAGLHPVGLAVAAGFGLVAAAFKTTSDMADEFAAKAQNIRRILDQTQVSGVVFKVLSDQFKKFGLDSDDLGAFLQQVNRRFSEMREGGGTFLKVVREIDGGIADMMQRATNVEDVLEGLQEAMKKAGTVFKQTELFQAAGGRGGPRSMAAFMDFDIRAAIDARKAELAEYEALIRKSGDTQNEIAMRVGKGNAALQRMVVTDIKERELEASKIFENAAKELEKNGDSIAIVGAQIKLLFHGEFKQAMDIGAAATRRQATEVRTLATNLDGLARAQQAYDRIKAAGGDPRRVALRQGQLGVGGADINDPLRSQLMPEQFGPPSPGPLDPKAQLAILKELISLMGAAASPADQLRTKMSELAIAAKQAGVSHEALARILPEVAGAERKVTEADVERAAALIRLEAAMAPEQRRLAILGQAASVVEIMAQKERDLLKAKIEGANFSPREEANFRRVAKEAADGTAAILQQTDALKVQAAVIGLNAGETARLTALKQFELNDLRTGFKASEADTAARKKAASALGEEAQALERLKIAADIKFDRATMLLSPEDVAIAQKLKGLYGNDIPAALASSEAAQMRLNAQIKQVSDLAGTFASGFLTDLSHGVKAIDALKNALTRLADTLIDIAARRLVTQAFGGLFGSATGGLFGSATGGLFGSATAAASPIAAVAHGGGMIGSGELAGRYVHPAYFDHAPKMHTGGGIDWAAGERPVVGLTGERMLNRHETAVYNRGGGRGASHNVSFGDTIVNVNGNADDKVIAGIKRELASNRAENAKLMKAMLSAQYYQSTGVSR